MEQTHKRGLIGGQQKEQVGRHQRIDAMRGVKFEKSGRRKIEEWEEDVTNG